MASIWLMETSHDRGQSWRLTQPYHVYKNALRAQAAERRMNQRASRFVYRAVEYLPVLTTAPEPSGDRPCGCLSGGRPCAKACGLDMTGWYCEAEPHKVKGDGDGNKNGD